MTIRTFFLCGLLVASAVFCRAEKPTLNLSPSEKGVQIDAGGMGKFTFPVPGLIIKPGDYSGEKAVIEVQGTTVVAKYPSGASLKIAVSNETKTASFSFEGVPADAKGFIATMFLPISYNKGGKFAFNQNPLTPFPETKEKQIIAGSGATKFTFVDPMDSGIQIQTPQNYQQVQDNRVFNWQAFVYIFNFTFANHPGKTSFDLKFVPVDGASVAAAPAAKEPAAAASAAAPQKAQLSLSTNPKGVQIDAGSMGKFTFPVPGLIVKPGDYSGEKATAELQGGTVVAKYPCGATLKINVSNETKTASFAFEGVPSGAKGFLSTMFIPMAYNKGGRFAFDDGTPKLFPETFGKQIVADATARKFTVVDPMDAGFSIQAPQNYQQVQDNRAFNWPTFVFIYNFTFANHPGQTSFDLKFAPQEGAAGAAGATAPRKFLVDRFGQSARKDFPTKVKSDEELKADVAKQQAALPKPAGPARDIYGGLAGSGQKYGLKKTGFFHVGDVKGRKVLVTPEGNAFFQLSVCGISIGDDYTTVGGRERTYEWIPPQDAQFGTAWRTNTPGVVSFYVANWIRKFGKPFSVEEWSGQAVERLRAWGFNSAGAFSSRTETMKEAKFPYVSFLPLGKYDGSGLKMLPDRVGAAELLDPFAPGAEEALEKVFAAKIAPKVDDPLLIGYFLGNEQHFELLPKMVAAYKASKVPAKAKLVETLQEKYGDIAKFNAAWAPTKPFASFEDLKEEPLFIRTDAAAIDVRAFYRLYLESYYGMVERVYRKVDKNHLLIGSRWTPGTANNEDVVRIGGKHLDVVSVNYYSYPVEKDFLKQVYDWSGGRPIILSEWYYSCTDQGLGAHTELKDQSERAKGYRNYVEQAAATPYVVGSQWFIYGDQSITGRFFEGFNGEGNNSGFVNVADRPYEELVAAACETHARIYDIMLGKEKPFVFDDARFTGKGKNGGARVVGIPKALPGMQFNGSTTGWPGRPATPIEPSRLVFGNPNPDLRGDFRLCWDEKALYFLIQVKDKTPLLNDKEPKGLWGADCVELFIGARNIKETGGMIYSDRQILLGAGKEPKVFIPDHADEAAQCKILTIKDVSGDGYVLEVSIPWNVLGVSPKADAEMLFDVGIDNSDDGATRKQQLMWNGTSKNGSDRASWGRARLTDN